MFTKSMVPLVLGTIRCIMYGFLRCELVELSIKTEARLLLRPTTVTY